MKLTTRLLDIQNLILKNSSRSELLTEAATQLNISSTSVPEHLRKLYMIHQVKDFKQLREQLIASAA